MILGDWNSRVGCLEERVLDELFVIEDNLLPDDYEIDFKTSEENFI
jgi:hypothetical protein